MARLNLKTEQAKKFVRDYQARQVKSLPAGTVITPELSKRMQGAFVIDLFHREAVQMLRDHVEPKVGSVLSRIKKKGLAIEEVTDEERAYIVAFIAKHIDTFKAKNPTIKLKKQK